MRIRTVRYGESGDEFHPRRPRGGGVFVKYKVNESAGNEPSLEVKLEPLWRRSTLIDLVKDVVAGLLGLEANQIRPDRPLTDLGFDSAGALRLREKLSKRLNVEVPPTLLFDYPTINDMVDRGLAQAIINSYC